MADPTKYDDPVWEYVMFTKLQDYITPAREFWKHITDIEVNGTGVFQAKDKFDNMPSGLMYRVTSTPVRSPIKGIQVFPFVPVAYLQLTNIAGGAIRMVDKLCADGKFKIEEFTIISKSNLPSTYHSGPILAIIPTEELELNALKGKYIYLTCEEMVSLCTGKVPESVRYKVIKYI